MANTRPNPPAVRLFYFWIGILATLAYRSIIILNNYSNVWVQAVWYFGTVGFLLYFFHRYQVSKQRARVIAEYRLAERVQNMKELNADERQAMQYVFSTLGSSKERWNYITIFLASGLALIVGIYLDFIA